MKQTYHRAVRLILLVWAVALAFGLGVERSRAAAAAYPSCEQICAANCEPHDGCDDYFAGVGICYFWCIDGYHGEVQMGR
jgi:hypothetical protein